MDKNIEKKIIEVESTIPKIDGHKIIYNLLNRVYGLSIGGLGAFLTYKMPYISPLTIPLIIEGAGDLMTGKHHFISYRLFKIHPKDEIKRLKEKSELSDKLD